MNMKKLKWLSTLLTILCVGVFEFVRHEFLHIISMDWGNLLVALFAGMLFFLYFHGIFAVVERLYNKLQKEKEERAVLQERDRIARELHDNVAQALFFMNIKVTEIESRLRQRGESFQAVADIKDALKLTDTEIRHHIFSLQKTPLPESIDLTTSVQETMSQFQQSTAIAANLVITGDCNNKLTTQVKQQLLRILQELLVNIRKHAAAKAVDVQMTVDDNRFSLIIRDDGKGFQLNTIHLKPSSFGFKNLEGDVRAIGAAWKLTSVPDGGTTVSISLNLA
jgi:signal transduction histidine kinase